MVAEAKHKANHDTYQATYLTNNLLNQPPFYAATFLLLYLTCLRGSGCSYGHDKY